MLEFLRCNRYVRVRGTRGVMVHAGYVDGGVAIVCGAMDSGYSLAEG